jgi:AraC-like DNA-binding protein
VYKKRNMDVNPNQVRFLRRHGWTLQAIANHVGCSVSTVFRKTA